MKIVALRARSTRKFHFVTTLCFVAALAGCGRKEAAPASEALGASRASSAAEPAELPLNQQTEQKLDPLTRDGR